MKHLLFLLSFSCLATASKAQTSEDSVKLVVNRLFDAMKNSDATALVSCFADSAILQTISKNKEGKDIIETDPVSAFAAIIGKLPKGSADERIIFDMIKIDGPLAIVWAPYKFFFNGLFSHCGVDSFQLVRINGEWKIQYLVDTRRKKGCE